MRVLDEANIKCLTYLLNPSFVFEFVFITLIYYRRVRQEPDGIPGVGT